MAKKAEYQMNYELAASKCGLGEIGMSGTLLTDDFGPLQRYCFVLTDAELEPTAEFVPHICDNCGKCVKACPGNAIHDTYSYGGVGTLHATLGTSYSASGAHREIGMPYQNKGFMVAVGLGNGKDGKTHNMGIYMKFTAPVSGNVTLNLSDFAEARTACRVLIIKGDTVVQAYGSIPLRAVVDLGYMNKGQSVCICYGTNSENIYNYGGSPIATVSGEKVTVSFNNSLAFEAQQTDYLMTYGDKFVLSDKADEIGKTILGWKDELGDYYAVGEEYTAESDITFDADQRYFGDLDGDSDINASDITSMRKDILSGDTNILAVSDVNTDGTFDIRDLVRMKKWLAGLSIAFNEQ